MVRAAFSILDTDRDLHTVGLLTSPMAPMSTARYHRFNHRLGLIVPYFFEGSRRQIGSSLAGGDAPSSCNGANKLGYDSGRHLCHRGSEVLTLRVGDGGGRRRQSRHFSLCAASSSSLVTWHLSDFHVILSARQPRITVDGSKSGE